MQFPASGCRDTRSLATARIAGQSEGTLAAPVQASGPDVYEAPAGSYSIDGTGLHLSLMKRSLRNQGRFIGYGNGPRDNAEMLGANIRSCRQQGLPGLPWCAGVPVRRACRTGTVPLAVELIEGHGAGGEREPGRDARMPPGSRTGLRDGRAAGRVPADPGRSGAGRRTPARNHRAGRGSGRRPDAREPRGGAGRRGPGSPGYRRVQLSGASRPVVPSR